MKQSLIVVLVTLLLSACVTFSLDGLSPSTQVYAMQKEFNDLYLPPINRYAAQDFCDATADPPLIVGCADAKTVIVLNDIAQETGEAIVIAQKAVRDVDAACALPAAPGNVSGQLCTDNTKILALSIDALCLVLARLSSEYVKAGLNK